MGFTHLRGIDGKHICADLPSLQPRALPATTARLGERRKEGVARRLEHTAAVRLDALTQDDIVACECDLHRVRRVLPQAGTTLDVR